MMFPYDFGFVPSTKADDGDPVDVLVMMDEPGDASYRVVPSVSQRTSKGIRKINLAMTVSSQLRRTHTVGQT